MAGRPRGRPKKAAISTIFTAVPEAIKPLAEHKDIKSYILTGNFEDDHEKVYFFIIWETKKRTFVTRFWGPWASKLSYLTDEFDKDELQSLINEKGKHGYRLFKDADYEAEEDIFADYVDTILKTIDSVKKSIK